MLAQPKKKVAPLSNIFHTTAKQPMPTHNASSYESYHHDYNDTGYKRTNLTGPDDASRVVWALGMFLLLLIPFFN
jgi:hypothetical protein